MDWRDRAQKGFLASGIDPADRKGHKNYYIDLLQKMALQEVMELKGDEIVLDFGCGSGRLAYWIAPKVKKVVGLEVTPEMIELAERHRTVMNVDFMVYDGLDFIKFPFSFDLVLSMGVLQYMSGEVLRRTISQLADYLKKDGRGYFIEQVSDNPKIDRPSLNEYLMAFQTSGLKYLRHYPIRQGRWWMIYLIQCGVIPKKLFGWIAKNEILRCRRKKGPISYYYDYLFVLRKS